MRTVKCEFESYSGEEKEGLTAGEMLCKRSPGADLRPVFE